MNTDFESLPQVPSPEGTFAVRLSSTPRGARLARHLAVQQLAEWGIPHATGTSHAVAMVTAELAANAITHGRTPGRDFRLALRLLPEVIRVEVTDTRPDRLPHAGTAPATAATAATSGRGLLLVGAYAQHWGHTVNDQFTKTVWAEF
ncbi:ATP-binding protein [Streptomyces sp. NPDC002867]